MGRMRGEDGWRLHATGDSPAGTSGVLRVGVMCGNIPKRLTEPDMAVQRKMSGTKGLPGTPEP